MLRAPRLSPSERSPKQQEELTRFLERSGVSVVPVYAVNPGADAGAVNYGYAAGRDLAEVLGDPTTLAGLANGLILRHYELVTLAHDCGVVIADRWPGNAIVVPPGTVKLIDFDLGYSGQLDHLKLFEESFCILQSLALLATKEALRLELQRKLVASLVIRHGQVAARNAWRWLGDFYLSDGRPRHEASLPADAYRPILLQLVPSPLGAQGLIDPPPARPDPAVIYYTSLILHRRG